MGSKEDNEIVVKTLSSVYLFEMICFVCFRNGDFHNVVSTFTNVVHINVENDNVV